MALPVIHLRKLLLDTNVFIDYLRDGLHEDWVAGRDGRSVRFLSAVVLFELRVGADTPKRRRAVDDLLAAFPSARVLAPTPEHYDRAADVFRLMHAGGPPTDRLGPMNDILIAITAWHMGATVVTENARDFTRIAKHLPGLLSFSPRGLDD